MLYVFQHKPLVTALTLWSLLCLIVVPLSAQNILILPGMALMRPQVPYMPYAALQPELYRIPLPARDILPMLEEQDRLPSEIVSMYTELKKEDDPDELREAWKQAFGFDVWYPYYKKRRSKAGSGRNSG